MKPAKSVTDFLATVFGDGMNEDGLGKVVYGVGKLGGQALASDWSSHGRFFL